MALLQSPPLDPAAYGGAQWGVLGALVFVIVVLGAIVYSVFVKGSASQQKRDEFLVEFLTGHTEKVSASLSSLGDKVKQGDDRIANALYEQGRMFSAVLVTVEAFQRARERRSGGNGLSPAEISQILREAHEVVRRGGGG